jgi:hypothetical protein
MPLIKSKSDKAFKKNIATEVKAGKPVKQAVAIAYSTKRAVKKAVGGSLNPMHYDSDVDYYEAVKSAKQPKYSSDWTREDEHASRAVKEKYDRKYAGMTMAQQREALLKKDDERNKRLGLGKYKVMAKCDGGKITKKSGW